MPLGVIGFAMSFNGIFSCCIQLKVFPRPHTCNGLESRFGDTPWVQSTSLVSKSWINAWFGGTDHEFLYFSVVLNVFSRLSQVWRTYPNPCLLKYRRLATDRLHGDQLPRRPNGQNFVLEPIIKFIERARVFNCRTYIATRESNHFWLVRHIYTASQSEAAVYDWQRWIAGRCFSKKFAGWSHQRGLRRARHVSSDQFAEETRSPCSWKVAGKIVFN